MLKFARHFFIVFIVTTIIPLISLFIWTNLQMKSMDAKRSANFVEIGARHFQLASKQHLKMKEYECLEVVNSLESQQNTTREIQKQIKASEVKLIYDKNVSNIIS